jgi:hypothetical protein
MAKSAWIPLGIGGVASILIISGIQGESLGEVLKGEFGKGTKHPSPNPAFKGKSGESAVESEPGTVESVANGTTANSFAGAPFAPSPTQTFSSPSINRKRCEELKHGLSVALGYKGQLESQVAEGHVNQQIASQQFHTKFPWYSQWAQEARLCL